MKTKLAFLIPCLALFVACADQQTRALRRVELMLECLIGHTEEEVILQLGAPESTQDVAGFKVYHYHKSYGTCTQEYTDTHCYGLYSTSTRNTWEMYDKFDLFFRDGRVETWKCSVKR